MFRTVCSDGCIDASVCKKELALKLKEVFFDGVEFCIGVFDVFFVVYQFNANDAKILFFDKKKLEYFRMTTQTDISV